MKYFFLHACRVNRFRQKTRRSKFRSLEWPRRKHLRGKSDKVEDLVKGAKRVQSVTDVTEIVNPAPSGLRQAAWWLRCSLPRDEKKRVAVLHEINRIEKIDIRRELCFGSDETKSTSLTQDILAITKSRTCKNFYQVDKIVKNIKKNTNHYEMHTNN